MNLPPSNGSSACQAGFPIRQSEEHHVSRRLFAQFACCSAVAFGAAWLGKGKLLELPLGTSPRCVAHVSELSVGEYKLFRYPTENDPCILVRLSESEFAAYSQSCTHLLCPVQFRPEQKQFHCPCHEGFFSAEDGRVLAGPPRRALPRYPLEIRDGQIWIKPSSANAGQMNSSA